MNYDLLLNEDILADLGKRLRQHRMNQKLTTAELAKRSGVSTRTINGFERGEKNVSLVNLIEWLRALNLLSNLEQLFPKIPLVTPLELVEKEKRRRKRASRKWA